MSVLSDLGACYRWAKAGPGRTVEIEHADADDGCRVSLMYQCKIGRRIVDGRGQCSAGNTLAKALVPAGQWARADMAKAAKAKRRAK